MDAGSRPRRPAGKENPRRRNSGAGGGSEDGEARTKPPRPGLCAYLRAPNAPAMLAASLSAWNVPATPIGAARSTFAPVAVTWLP